MMVIVKLSDIEFVARNGYCAGCVPLAPSVFSRQASPLLMQVIKGKGPVAQAGQYQLRQLLFPPLYTDVLLKLLMRLVAKGARVSLFYRIVLEASGTKMTSVPSHNMHNRCSLHSTSLVS